MAWSNVEMILGMDGTTGSRVSNTFTPQDPGGGNELRVQVVPNNDNVLDNPVTHWTLRKEIQASVNGALVWQQRSFGGFTGAPGTDTGPAIGINIEDYGKLHRFVLESATNANVSLWLQSGVDD